MLETRPISARWTRRGIIASLKTIENSAAICAATIRVAASASEEPGAAVHRSDRAETWTTASPPIQGLRGPARSAIAPISGERHAAMMPVMVAAKAHQACPVATSGASCETKYGPKTKVMTTVNSGWAAKSKAIQPQTAGRRSGRR